MWDQVYIQILESRLDGIINCDAKMFGSFYFLFLCEK